MPEDELAFNLYVKKVVQNKAPDHQMLCASRLKPLAQQDGGVRSIVEEFSDDS